MLWCGIWQPRTLRRPVTLDIEPSSVSPNSHSVASRPRDGSRSEDAQSAPSQLKDEARCVQSVRTSSALQPAESPAATTDGVHQSCGRAPGGGRTAALQRALIESSLHGLRG